MFSMILPVHNEESKIEPCVKTLVKLFRSKGFKEIGTFEIIIAEDGSTDKSADVGRAMEKQYKEVRFFHSKSKLGRGKAVKNSIEKARGDKIGYMDVDMATDISHIKELITSLDDYDYATGSRYASGSKSSRTGKRLFFSRAYNLLVRLTFGSKINDHQCGFKSFRKSSIEKVNRFSKADHWFWDTESLVLANKMGMRVREFPVRWKESRTTTVKFKRDILGFMRQVIDLRIRLWKGI
jgi:glycosyltransferase involved in cell wall biosynthesis